MGRYLRNEKMVQPAEPRLPRTYVEPVTPKEEELLPGNRAETPRAPAEWRVRNFSEVEVSLSIEEASCEASRCLRCDLEFTQPKEGRESGLATGGILHDQFDNKQG